MFNWFRALHFTRDDFIRDSTMSLFIVKCETLGKRTDVNVRDVQSLVSEIEDRSLSRRNSISRVGELSRIYHFRGRISFFSLIEDSSQSVVTSIGFCTPVLYTRREFSSSRIEKESQNSHLERPVGDDLHLRQFPRGKYRDDDIELRFLISFIFG